MRAYRIIATQALTRAHFQIPVRAKNLSTLLECILNLACCEQRRSTCIRPIILVVRMQQSKLVVICDSRVECADRQLQCTAHLVDPSYTLQADGVLFGVAHVDICETFLYPRLQNVGLCYLNV
jgi:hypothetical protein